MIPPGARQGVPEIAVYIGPDGGHLPCGESLSGWGPNSSKAQKSRK
jgi:hypothetical protein